MNSDIRTLKLVVEAFRQRHEFVSTIEAPGRIDAASDRAVSELGIELDPGALSDRFCEILDDEQFAERVDELAADEDRTVGQPGLLASAIEPQSDELTAEDSAVDREAIAETFVEALQRELLSPVDDEALTLHAVGIDALRAGAFESAEASFRLSLDLARAFGDRSTEADSHVGLGHIAIQHDDHGAAESHYEEGLDIAREIDARSTEAESIAGLGSVATSREAYEMAETYLRESLDLKRLVGDESGEATALASLGDLAAEREAFETAVGRYTEALPLFAAAGDTSERIQTQRCLVDCEIDRGDDAAAIERCDEALALFDDGEFSAVEETDRWFRTTRARLAADADAVDSLYAAALADIRDGDDPAAFKLLDGLWKCREAFDPGTEPHGRCLGAGVAFAAYHLLLDTDTELTRRAIVDKIDPRRAPLSEPADTLFRFVKSEGADRDLDIDTAGVDTADPALDELERLAYAEFLTRLSETPPPSELYSRALTGIVSGNASPSEVAEQCLVALQDADADASRAVLGARILVETYRELFEFRLPVDRADMFQRIEANRAALSDPLAALFDQLSTGSTATEPEALLDAADRSEPSLVDIERLVVAGFLEQLQG